MDPSLTHLTGRLDVIDHRVRAAVAARRGAPATPDSPFRGLYLSDQQVDGLLAVPVPSKPDVAGATLLAEVEADADRAEGDGAALRLRRAARAFSLEPIDVDLLLVAIAPDTEPRFERLYGYLHDDLTRRRATTGLALAICGQAVTDAFARSRLMAGSPLVDGGLIVVDDPERPFPSRSLRVPDRVTMHLLGDDSIDPLLASLQAVPVPCVGGDPDALARALAQGAGLCYLQERPGATGRGLAGAAFSLLRMPALALDLTQLRPTDDVEAIAGAAVREARLRGAALVAGPVEPITERDASLLRGFTEAPWPVVLTGARSWDPRWSRRVPLLVEVAPAGPDARAQMWRLILDNRCPDDVDPGTAVSSYRLGPEQIDRAATAAWLQASHAGRPLQADDLRIGARSQNAAGLERLAQRIEPRVGWDALVLPADVLVLLYELAGRAYWGERVYGDLGMGRLGRGGESVTALFTGPPGTGKTMAAEAVAFELSLDLYVVDLSNVVDKYIGETEKNLGRIFDEAERVNGVLLFDEADALFGKRSDVSDAHDRYANIETAYLLQRMDTFNGIAILTTNLRANLDDAFARRLDAVVEFPIPDVDQRLELWTRSLGTVVPRNPDVDLAFCARAFELSGGHIRNVALAAVFYAAEGDRPVEMADLIRATQREYQKLGRLCVEAEFGPYFELIAQ